MDGNYTCNMTKIKLNMEIAKLTTIHVKEEILNTYNNE